MYFKKLLKLVSLKESDIKNYREFLSEKPHVQIFGAGENGRAARRFVESLGGKVSQFLDNAQQKQGTTLDGLPVVGPDRLQSGTRIVIASTWGREIARQLKTLGRTDYMDFSFCFDHMYQTHFDIEPMREAAHCLCDFHDALVDDASVAVWIGLVRYRLTLDPAYIVTSAYPQYLSPLTEIKSGDLIVDGGAWIGDSAQAFIDSVNGDCRVLAFEPAAPNFLRLTNENTSLVASGRIIPVNKGLWDKATTLRINTSYENSGRSKLDQNGEDIINLIRLDEYFEDSQIVSAIKFDLEGAEQQALRGATETIRIHRPRLMLSIYHHGNDFWEIFRLVKTIHPDYQISLGHHSASMFETVLYAR